MSDSEYDMSLSVRLSCIVYTLQGKSVKENKYIDIFLIWLAYVCKYAKLNPIDCIQIIIDENTYAEVMKDNIILQIILSSLRCEVQFIKVLQPKTHGEGMMNKYKYTRSQQDVFMYCDIDVLFQKPIRILLQGLEENTVVVHNEGCIQNKNYGGAFTSEEIQQLGENFPGFSAGKFIIYGQELHSKFFALMNTLGASYPVDSYYCLEQPIFNLGIYKYQLMNTIHINDMNIAPPFVCTNISDKIPEECVLLDYMGQPGDGELHFQKILSILIHDFLSKK